MKYCAVLLLLCSAASGATYYLNPNTGDNGDTGLSDSNAWETLTYAMANVASGSTVIMAGGTYDYFDPAINWTGFDSWTTFIAADGETPIVPYIYMEGSIARDLYIIFDGITVQPGNYGAGYDTYIYDQHGSYLQILRCTFIGNGYSEKDTDKRGIFLYSQNFQITDVNIVDCNFTGTGSAEFQHDVNELNRGAAHAIYGNLEDGVISGNTIRYHGSGMSIGSGPNGNLTISNNHIYECQDNGIVTGGKGVTIEDNHIHDIVKPTGISFSYAIIDVNQTDKTFTLAGNVDSFVDARYSPNQLEVWGSTGNDGLYTRSTSAYIDGNTLVTVTNTIASATVDGNLGLKWVTHNDGIQVNHNEDCDDITIRRNYIYNVGHQGLFLNPVSGSNWLIENNLIHDVPIEGTSSYSVTIAQVDGFTFRNNTVVSSTSILFRKNYPGDPTVCTSFHNNICRGLNWYEDPNSDSYGNITCLNENYNIYVDIGYAMTTHVWGANTVQVTSEQLEALFIDYDANDFTLAPYSLAINFGDDSNQPADSLGSIDANGFVVDDGTARDSSHHSAGAVEYGAGGGENNIPVLTGIGAQTISENRALTFDVDATDADGGDTLTFSCGNLPPGAAINSSSGVFTWTPTYRQSGLYNVVIGVTDTKDQDSEVVTITVTNSPQGIMF